MGATMGGSTLTKDLLAELFHEKLEIPIKDTKDILEMIIEEVKLALEAGHNVKISGFGKWAIKNKRPRRGRNPHTGDQLEISARRVVTFHPSDKLRDAINSALG